MSARGEELPDGFVVRLHDEVKLGTFMTCGAQVVRLPESARQMLSDRAVRVGSRASSRLAGQLLDLDLAEPVVDEPSGPWQTEVTIIVPVRDNHLGVARVLAACGDVVECVVVDDASRDPRSLAEVVTRRGARLVRLGRNVGPAAARNAGLRVTHTPYAAFVDSDVHVTSDVLRRLMAHFADPGLAAVAPRIVSAGGRGWLWPYERDCGSLDLGSRSASTRPWTRVSYVPSACMIARVAYIDTGFDPAMRSGEDVDLVWRLNQSGLRVRHVADVSVRHDARPTAVAWLRRKAFYGTSAAPLARRHGDRMAPAVMAPSTAVAIAGLAVQRRWSLVVAAAAASTTIARTWSAVPDLPAAERRQLVRATAAGVAWQTSGLVLRHWSPLALALCTRSRRARRAVGVLAVVDGILAHRAARPGLDVARFTLARRAEHLAYGVGVWTGAAQDRSIRCLVPKWLPPRSRGTRA